MSTNTDNTSAADAINDPAKKMPWTSEDIREQLKVVIDPELQMNIVDLGLIYEVEIKDDKVTVRMTLTSPGCPFGPYLMQQVKETTQGMQGVRRCRVKLVWEPAWSPEKMSEDARLEFGFDI